MSSIIFPFHCNAFQLTCNTDVLHIRFRYPRNSHNLPLICLTSYNPFLLDVLQTDHRIQLLRLLLYLVHHKSHRIQFYKLLYIMQVHFFRCFHQNITFRFHLHNKELPYNHQIQHILLLTYQSSTFLKWFNHYIFLTKTF